MKKFIKYKGFLPPRYVDEKISKNKKNNNQIIEELHNSEHNKDDDNLNILI